MNQKSTTILVPVIPEKIQDLLDQLADIKQKSQHGISKEFDELSIIHFARWVVIDHGKSYIKDEQKRNPKLLFVIDYDGDEGEMLHKVCESSSTILDLVYVFCEGYPPLNTITEASRHFYLESHVIKDAAVYIGAPGRSVMQIRKEKKLRDFIREFIDSRSWEDVPAETVHLKIKEQVLSNAEFSYLKGERVNVPRINYVGAVLLGICLLALLPFILILVLIVHFFYERKDENFTKKRSQLDDGFLTELEMYEDFKNQNQFTQLVDMKEGTIRLISIKFMFLLSNFLIKFIFTQGKLMGIPTIHFAKWVMFEKNSRVLFFSNFDGSWQQYLGDFIDNSGWGLTGIFSNTKVFPKTNFLITGGAYREEYFLAWSRNSELVTNFWYTAYPDLSIKNINNNTRIRVQLMKTLSERQAAKFLKLL
ncbi:hypothetical protein SAMN04489724_0501 [Algoriphagus locisalis]|uniref:Uncharacterized protein n=1 Tax=Algoriphagus locisalis TaxID=305507 RepID=A0A1I6XIW7_9BACT|nr:hypothetical protein [Algoriphagus locisalis]SFT38043.1 hypothetical protein SAMN04489724_0501 [Algoriphagus locisalis]